jgi:parvulin-like peptidyl-prolyl isomerase
MKINKKQAITYGILTIILLLFVSLMLTYITPLRDPITVSFKRLYPAAFIGSRIISVNDLEESQIVAKRLGVSKEAATREYISNEKSAALVDQLNLAIPSDADDDEINFYSKGNESDFTQLIDGSFNGSERSFYRFIVVPQVNDAYLRMKFYSDTKEQSPAYKKVLAILERLSKGEKFEDLAKAESEDKITAQLGGDLGFYESGQLLPELEDQISISSLGEYRKDVIISRLGYHIIYPVEYSNVDGKKLWHAKHMLLVPDGYEEWLKQQHNTINVTYLKRY